jgi:hypothetical protein
VGILDRKRGSKKEAKKEKKELNTEIADLVRYDALQSR